MEHPTNGHGNGATGNVLWQQTPAGKARLSATMKRSRAENPYSTKAIPPATIAKAKQLKADGKQAAEIAKKLKMSVASVKRHTAVPRTSAAAKAKSGLGRRIPEPTKRRIRKLLAAGIPPMEVAKRTKVHQSSVYHQRSLMKAASDESEPETTTTTGALPPLMTMAGFRQAKKYTYTQVWDQRRELSGSELRWLLTLDQMMEGADASE